jgi:putative PIN family toxin of toxin-antitoxin system
LISPRGAPADIYRALTRGRFESVTSPDLLAELERVLLRPKFRRYGPVEDARRYVSVIARLGVVVEDPPPARHVAADPADDYLVTLARSAGAEAIVSGDRHLLDLPDMRPPVRSCRPRSRAAHKPPPHGARHVGRRRRRSRASPGSAAAGEDLTGRAVPEQAMLRQVGGPDHQRAAWAASKAARIQSSGGEP